VQPFLLGGLVRFEQAEQVHHVVVDLVHDFDQFGLLEVDLDAADEVALLVVVCVVEFGDHFDEERDAHD